MKKLHQKIIGVLILARIVASCATEPPIDREALVNRHQVINTSFDSLESLTVGNGSIAFTVDFTGLQTFPKKYMNGIPLGTQSDWGWHSFPNESDFHVEETYFTERVHGKDIDYSIQMKDPPRQNAAADYSHIKIQKLAKHQAFILILSVRVSYLKRGPH